MALQARCDRYEAQKRRFVFPVNELPLGRSDGNLYRYSRSGVPVVCTIELAENDDIICSGGSGFIWPPEILLVEMAHIMASTTASNH